MTRDGIEAAKRELIAHVRSCISIAVCDGSMGTIGATPALAQKLVDATLDAVQEAIQEKLTVATTPLLNDAVVDFMFAVLRELRGEVPHE